MGASFIQPRFSQSGIRKSVGSDVPLHVTTGRTRRHHHAGNEIGRVARAKRSRIPNWSRTMLEITLAIPCDSVSPLYPSFILQTPRLTLKKGGNTCEAITATARSRRGLSQRGGTRRAWASVFSGRKHYFSLGLLSLSPPFSASLQLFHGRCQHAETDGMKIEAHQSNMKLGNDRERGAWIFLLHCGMADSLHGMALKPCTNSRMCCHSPALGRYCRYLTFFAFPFRYGALGS